MIKFKNIDIKQTIKIIAVIKVVIIIAVLGVETKNIYFGDSQLSAKGSEKGAEKRQSKSEGKDSKGSSNQTIAGSDSSSPAEPMSKKRKSFLDGLLNLPNLDIEKSRNDEIGRYLTLAERKKQQVEERLDLLDSRESHLLKIEGTIDEKLARLEEERLFFAQTIQKEKVVQGERLEKLVLLYGKMEPKKSGPVFEKLDRDLVVALFDRMKQKTVTKILEVMPADRAKDLTEYFGRIRSGKEYDLLREMNQSLRSAFDECKGL